MLQSKGRINTLSKPTLDFFMTIRKANIFFALLCMIFCACKNDLDQSIVASNVSTLDSSRVNSSALLSKAMNNGDTTAYDEAFAYSIDRNGHDHFFYYALQMANRYHYAKAYFHVYFILSTPSDGQGLDKLDTDTHRMAMYYLLKAYEMGQENARSEVAEIFKNKPVPKSATFQ